MARKKGGDHGGGDHGWFVTFADLMGLLVAFFVILVAFSTQDSKKLQIVAGSMRDAFGVQNAVRLSGMIEIDGLPTRPRLKNAGKINPEDASPTPGPTKTPATGTSVIGSKRPVRSRSPPRRCVKRCRICLNLRKSPGR